MFKLRIVWSLLIWNLIAGRLAPFRNNAVDKWQRKTLVNTGAAVLKGKLHAFNQVFTDFMVFCIFLLCYVWYYINNPPLVFFEACYHSCIEWGNLKLQTFSILFLFPCLVYPFIK